MSIGCELERNVDVVVCLDATGSMSKIFDEVKENILGLYRGILIKSEACETPISKLRMKIIAFRNYEIDSVPMLESKFFNMEREYDDFVQFLNSIHPSGGYAPENALEALALAMRSDWIKTGAARRHIIFMFTDAGAKPLGTTKSANYPKYMPSSLVELNEAWEDPLIMDKRAKRLIVFAPDCEPWQEFQMWQNAYHSASKASHGSDDIDMECVANMVLFNDL